MPGVRTKDVVVVGLQTTQDAARVRLPRQTGLSRDGKMLGSVQTKYTLDPLRTHNDLIIELKTTQPPPDLEVGCCCTFTLPLKSLVHSSFESAQVLFVVKKGSSYYPREAVRAALGKKASSVAKSLGLDLIGVQEDECDDSSGFGCDNGQCSDTVFMDETGVRTHGEAGISSFVAPGFSHAPVCVCREGFAGDKCEVMLNQCALQPCPSFKVSLANCKPLLI